MKIKVLLDRFVEQILSAVCFTRIALFNALAYTHSTHFSAIFNFKGRKYWITKSDWETETCRNRSYLDDHRNRTMANVTFESFTGSSTIPLIMLLIAITLLCLCIFYWILYVQYIDLRQLCAGVFWSAAFFAFHFSVEYWMMNIAVAINTSSNCWSS